MVRYALWALMLLAGLAQAQSTTRVSMSSAGAEGNRASWRPSLSADGRFVAFDSLANNLVPGDTNARTDVFVHDRVQGITTRVSISLGGGQGTDNSAEPSISGDGRFVAFGSGASNLVPGGANGRTQVYVHDRVQGSISRVSVSSAGLEGDGDASAPSISADGRAVAFRSSARNLVDIPPM